MLRDYTVGNGRARGWGGVFWWEMPPMLLMRLWLLGGYHARFARFCALLMRFSGDSVPGRVFGCMTAWNLPYGRLL